MSSLHPPSPQQQPPPRLLEPGETIFSAAEMRVVSDYARRREGEKRKRFND